ncbi:MAG: AAA family ATPase, partial [Acidobacteriota bacterium]
MASVSLKSGTTVGDRYRVERLLGQGEPGYTYLCRDLMERDSPVALKTLNTWDGETAALRAELSLLSRFRHPRLVHLLDFGVLDRGPTPYLVRPFIEGVEIFEGSAGWGVDQILPQLVRICRVLQFLHSRGILHGHLKPSNVFLVDGEGSELELQVLDFGLDRRTRKSRRDRATLAYTAPEILLGHSQNPRSDFYSLGILAYQLLARRLPFDDDDEGYLIQKHLQGKADIRPIEHLRDGAGLAQVLLGLLEKDPEKRPSSAEDVIRLLSAASGRDYSGAVSGSTEAYFSSGRFVGRDKEMAFLQERATRVRENGRGWTAFITGESGAGKSRCLEELRTWALLEGWRVVEAGCLPREDRSYGPYRRILARAALLRPAESGSSGESAIFRFDDAARVAESPGFELSSGSAAGPFRDQLTREVVRLLSDRPTLLLLHDFHWADEATITVLDYLTSDILAHPIFLCASLRPGEAEQGPLGRLMEMSARQLRAETMALEALPPQAVGEMIVGITGEPTLAGDLGSWVHKCSGGNPFFVEEILKHLVDRGLLRREMGKWRFASENLKDLEVPSSVATVLRHRLAQLSPGAITLTEWLALIRRAVPKDQLQALSSLDSDELEARLRELISRQVIREVSGGGGCFEFRHALISEVIAEDLPGGRRRRMHRRIGEMLEEQHGDQENLQELATHFTQGPCGEKAIGYALRAARMCKAEFANESALRFYEFLLRHKIFLTEEQLCQVCIEAADTYCALGSPKRAIQILEAQLKSLRKNKRHLAVQLYTQLSRSFQYLGDMEKSERAAKRGMELLRENSNFNIEAAETLLLSQLAFCFGNRSQPRKALAILKRSSCLRSNSPCTIAAGHLHILISGLHWVACDFDEGVIAAKTAIEILEKLNANHLLPMAYSHLGINLAAIGKLGLALEQHERAVSAGKRTRSLFLLAQALCNLTECFCQSGKLDAATENSGRVAKIASETENHYLAYAGILCLLETQIATAEWSAAYKTVKYLTSAELATLPIYMRARALLLCASLHVELGCLDSAISDLDGLSRLISSETPLYEASLGEVLRARICAQQGRLLEARGLLEHLEAKVTQKHWAFQMALTKLQLAEILLMAEDWKGASAKSRDSLRLARAMPAIHLQAKAHCLQGRIALLQAEKLISGEVCSNPGKSLVTDALLDAAYLELGRAIILSNNRFMVDSAWRAHYMMMRLCQLRGNLDLVRIHAEETLRLLSIVEGKVPVEMLDLFKKGREPEQTRSECESVVQETRGTGEKATLT